MQTNLELVSPPPRRAVFSPCGRFRYSLVVELIDTREEEQADLRRIAWVMLNPSIADETRDDPTVARCIKRSRMWGYHQLQIVNVYALVSTDPRGLKIGDDAAVGPDNDSHIAKACGSAHTVVCAWGRHASRRRVEQLAVLLGGVRLSALKVNGDGSPSHPLYLPDALRPTDFSL